MYQVQIFEDYRLLNPLTIHHATAFGNKLSKGEVKQILNGLDLFVCSLSLNNVGYRKVEPIKNIVIVKNTLTNSIVFEGRVREVVNTMSNMNETLHCESLLAYLYDSYQIYRGMGNDSVEAYFRLIIEQHNRTVEAHKRFKVGLVTVVNSTDNVYRGINYTSTMDLIKDKLINRLGGYLRYRRVNGELVIDYLKEIGEVSETPLQLSKNLVNATKNLKSDELVTRIVPVGAEIETEDEPESSPNVDITRPRITIGDVNGGVLHLDDPELIKRFGVMSKVVDWNDVNIPSILKKKGQNFLDNQRVFLTTWNIDAIELGLIDKRFEEFVIGNSYPIINPYLSSVETLQVIERSIDINNPQKSNLTIGNGVKTLSQYQLESRETEKTLEDLKYMYSSSERKLRLLKDQYDYLKEQSELIPEQQRLLEELAQRIKELEEQLNPPDPTQQKGTDLSEHNTSIDWLKLKSTGHSFVMIRAGYGQTTYDKLADTHATAASLQGFKLGLYWFSYAKNINEAIQEANKACDFADKYKIDYPISWDWENDSERYVISQGVTPTKQLVSDMALAFCNRVVERGYKPMNYSNLDYYNKYFDNRVKVFDWWLARPGIAKPDVPCAIWQNELDVDGTSRGINGNADFDISFKNY